MGSIPRMTFLALMCVCLLEFLVTPGVVNAQTPSWESMNAEGMAAFRHQQYDQARTLFLQALDTLGEESKSAARRATTLNNLGATHKALGEFDQAKLRYQHSLTLVETIQGHTHPDVAVGLNNLASLLFEHEDYAQSELLWIRGLQIYETHLGVDHPHLVPSLQALALVTSIQHKHVDSEAYYKRTIQIITQSLGPRHHRLIPVLELYADLLRSVQRTTEADLIEAQASSIKSATQDSAP